MSNLLQKYGPVWHIYLNMHRNMSNVQRITCHVFILSSCIFYSQGSTSPLSKVPCLRKYCRLSRDPVFFGAAGRFQVPLACHILSKWEIDFEGGAPGHGEKDEKIR
jgi:hypothetical protein